MERFFVLSGCSGGGKSTLLAALAAAGIKTVPEPGRRVLRAGKPAPRKDMGAFLSACLALALEDHARAHAVAGPVIFDRCAIDAVSGLDALGEVVAEYGRLSQVFLAARYAIEIMPKVPVAERVAWIMARIGPPGV
ncbi:AAA family ATPase [Roseicyclus mahoneyensis]|uniref:Putative ATPase n=1 Tax=Roseicyclus mahoneyensis TaxID=164332 RepID=A0A316GKK6_9RHOB|nr:AAA family ATPase [Roseicyclus mahoneyensis]PWK60518.1 putative ATPase [Roseicyclus mahoneyensis]